MVESGRGEWPKRRIVVGVSGSLGSMAALHRAVLEARRSVAEVLVVHVWEPPGGERGYRRYPYSPLLAQVRAAAVGRLDEALHHAFASGAGVTVHGALVRGKPRKVLVDVADRGDDVLVVGVGSGSLLRRGLRRSVTAHCVKHANCPVLAVPRPPLQRELESVRRRLRWHLPVEPGPGGSHPCRPR